MTTLRVALVAVLFMTATGGCARKLSIQENAYGTSPCDGSLGNFDVYLIAGTGSSGTTYNGTYQLAIMPISLDAPGDIVSVTVLNESKAYKVLISQVSLAVGQEVDAGPLSSADLTTYDIMSLTPYQAGVVFTAQQNEKDAFCYIPQQGQGTTQQLQPLK